ncbi:hypothetical protein WMY93_003218 [Mugilogobius chulae]|uniref:Uncharacterized protein n=1 Tax=Mugilogobius chulae TaxID=88201 RepID=A0AAW0Q5U2_9GOBI
MVDTALCLEALSALSGCSVQLGSGASEQGPQDFVNIVNLRQFYKQEGFEQLEYPSIGSISLREAENRDMDDLYSAPLALPEPPARAQDSRPTVRVNPQDFFDRKFDYDFTNVKDGDRRFLRGNEPYTRPAAGNVWL